jgi:hypothetical protein
MATLLNANNRLLVVCVSFATRITLCINTIHRSPFLITKQGSKLVPLLSSKVTNQTATMIKDMMDKQVMELKKLWTNKRQLTFQVLNLAMIVFSALMIWKGLMFVTKVRLTLDGIGELY